MIEARERLATTTRSTRFFRALHATFLPVLHSTAAPQPPHRARVLHAHARLRAAAMPPRAAVAAAAECDAATTALLLALPDAVMHRIFILLPLDCRLRCAEVCRGWRSVLLEHSLWTRLDMSFTSGVHMPLRWGYDSLLRCAAARASGGLLSLHLEARCVRSETLRAVTAANAGTLRELHTHNNNPNRHSLMMEEVQALLAAAPLLHTFVTDIYCNRTSVQAARSALRNEAPFGPLRVRNLYGDLYNLPYEQGIVALAADVAAHASLEGLSLQNAGLGTDELDAVVDAALAQRLQSVSLNSCRLSHWSVPALARLLGSEALTTLACQNAGHMGLLNAPAARVLAAALRANATLTSLMLTNCDVWRYPAAGAELLDALTGHASLRVLSLSGNRPDAEQQAAVGATLGALVAANAPALTHLDVGFSSLGTAGLRPLFEALPGNSHLHTLDCAHADMGDAFARDVALPAQRAHVSLRQLILQGDDTHWVQDVFRELRTLGQL
jgi:hypothetical protein